MKIVAPKDHQELLDAYAQAMATVVSEYGGGADYKKVKEICEKYAKDHKLESPNIDWTIYIPEDYY